MGLTSVHMTGYALVSIFLLPRNLAVLLLRIYRAVVSPLYGDVCRFYPSCSSYALQSIQQHGLLIGMTLGIRRLVRCHPWAAGGIDDVKSSKNPRHRITDFGFVVARSHRKG